MVSSDIISCTSATTQTMIFSSQRNYSYEVIFNMSKCLTKQVCEQLESSLTQSVKHLELSLKHFMVIQTVIQIVFRCLFKSRDQTHHAFSLFKDHLKERENVFIYIHFLNVGVKRVF